MALLHRHAQTVKYGAFNNEIDYDAQVKGSLNPNWFKTASLDQMVQWFWWIGGFCLFVQFHLKGSARSLQSKFVFLWMANFY